MNTEKSKIKVLFRVRSLEMGGVVKALIDILQHLPKDRLEITVMVNLFQGELKNDLPKDVKLIKIARGKESYSSISFLNKIQLGIRLLKLRMLDTFPFLLGKLYYREKYDIEIAFGRAELEMVLKSPQKHSKKLGWVHWEFSHAPEVNKSDLLVSQLEKFDHVVFCSDNVRKQVKEIYGIEFASYSVFPNVIHPEEILLRSKENKEESLIFTEDLFTFSSVGRVKNGKGYPLLLEIHKELLEIGLRHRIVIVGDGDKLEELRKKAKDWNVSDTFLLVGNQQNPFPYLLRSDCFILPTQSEAYPLSVKEALVLGIPAVVTDVGGVSEIVTDGTDGILMKYDKLDIFQKMKKVLSDPELYLQLKKEASKSVSKFETDEIYKQIEQLFLNLNIHGE